MSPISTDQVWALDALPATAGVSGSDILPLLTGIMTYRATVAQLLGLAWPVGSVFTSIVATDPAMLLGFGTWVALAAGRVLVGVDAGDPDFDTPEETGGAKTVTLTEAQLPAHTHVQNAHSHGLTRFPTTTGASSGFTPDTSMSGTPTAVTQVTAPDTATNQATGGGQAHPNLPPYLAVYFWKRTA